jgi:phosphatidylglycerophosphatase A
VQRIAKVLASGLYCGYVPVAPATAASLSVAILYCLVPVPAAHLQLAGIAVLFFLGVRLAYVVEPLWGTDSPRIVIDEVVGFLVAMWLVPKSILTLGAAFLLFRLFDIWKPPPISQSQRLAGGWGVMIDDLLAGVWTNLCLRLILWIKG